MVTAQEPDLHSDQAKALFKGSSWARRHSVHRALFAALALSLIFGGYADFVIGSIAFVIAWTRELSRIMVMRVECAWKQQTSFGSTQREIAPRATARQFSSWRAKAGARCRD